MGTNESIHLMALAALLHDIGKVHQRAKGTETTHFYSGADFLDSLGLSFPALVARYHHNMDGWSNETKLITEDLWRGYIIQIADHLSAGQRDSEPERCENACAFISPLSTINEYEAHAQLALCSLSSFSWRPTEGLDSEEVIRKNYSELWNLLRANLRELVKKYGNSERSLCHSVFNALRILLLQVPSACWKSVPDISLFSHSHSTAAIAVCLWEWLSERHNPIGLEFFNVDNAHALPNLVERIKQSPACLLLAADMSGIQKFIYAVTNKGAAKLVKGRSFLISMLPRISSHYILRKFDLPETQILYAGGGNFYMLLPNTDAVRNELPIIFRTLNRALRERFSGMLKFVYSTYELSGVQLEESKFGNVWNQLHRKLGEKKKRKFEHIPDNEILDIFNNPLGNDAIIDQSKSENICEICKVRKAQFNEQKVCNECREISELGKKLRDCKWIVEKWGQQNKTDDWWNMKIGDDYVSLQLENMNDIDDDSYIYAVNRPLFTDINELINLPQNGLPGVLFYGGMHAPVGKDGKIRTFGELAGIEENEEVEQSSPAPVLGPHRYGVLRLDVDNLGKIFSEGVKLTIDRLATLSTFIELFFSYWLPESIDKWAKDMHSKLKEFEDTPPEKEFEDTPPGKEFKDAHNKYYILYSGGDDMFIIGSWDLLVPLAWHIREQFGEFTNWNPKVTLSGGLSFFPPKFPIRRAADMTQTAENNAKSFTRKVGEKTIKKDCINIFGVNVPWSDYERMHKIGEKIRWLIENNNGGKKKLPRSVLQRLYAISMMYAKHIRELDRQLDKFEQGIPLSVEKFKEGVANARWTWMLTYSLRKDYKELENLLKTILMENTEGGQVPPLEWLQASIAWADWITRKIKSGGKE